MNADLIAPSTRWTIKISY